MLCFSDITDDHPLSKGFFAKVSYTSIVFGVTVSTRFFIAIHPISFVLRFHCRPNAPVLLQSDMEPTTTPQPPMVLQSDMEPTTPPQPPVSANHPQRRPLNGPVPLILSFEEGEEEFTVPDPEQLPDDLGLSPSHKYLLRFLREKLEPDSNSSASELVGLTGRTTDEDQAGESAQSLNEEGLSSVRSQSPSAVVQHPVGKHKIPARFSPHGVRGLLRKVSRAVDLGAIKKKRRYQFHVRVPKPPQSPPLRRKLRLQRALRGENPFLQWSRDFHCCDRYRCFSALSPHYLYEEYKKVNGMNKLQAKRYLISLFNTSDRLWYVQGNKVCARFLQKAFGFSSDLQCQIKGTPRARSGPTPKSLPREVRKKTKRWYISNFILRIADRFAEAMPHKQQYSLPLFTKTMLWKEFEKYWNERDQTEREPLPSKCYFFSVWKKYASIVKVQKKRHGFSICTRCEMLRSEMAAHLRDEETLNLLIERYAHHLRFVKGERDGYEVRQSLAEENPSKYCSIILDGADQTNFGLPHFPTSTKSDKGHKLKCKIVGCLEHVLRGGEKLSLYAMTEEYETGANHVIEVAHRVLQRKKQESGKLPPHLFVQVDNCVRENKNRYFFAYFQCLVHLGVFKTIQISFLPIGHTHADIDQSFSSIGAHLSINDAYTLFDMICELSKCYAGRAKAFELDRIVNFSGLCESSGCLTNVDHFVEYRFFRFTCKERMSNHGLLSATCDVKVQEKDAWEPFPSSSAEGFLKFVPNFRSTPKTKTKELPNFAEISKCLDAAEERVKNDHKMEALRALRDKVFQVREEPFHWNVDCIFEMQGDYLTETEETAHLPPVHVEEQIRPSCGYDPDDFVAVETKEDENTKFWIARVKSVTEYDAQGRAKTLRIRWYVPRGSDAWSAKYIPAWKVSNGENTVYEDDVDVACVILRFSSFTTAGRLRVSDKKAIKQMLDAN